MRLQIKPNKQLPSTYIEIEVASHVDDVIDLMSNYYAVNKVRAEALHSLKAAIHAYADNLKEEDLEIVR